MTGLAADLLAWYDGVARDLPWRRSRDPYAIWVSEVMLQQTQVATVVPYFERWMARFPTIEALAAAPEDAVLKSWEGLGYYSRARHLQAAARQVVELHGGRVPSVWEDVRRLPGVGDYTAGAILSIAYAAPVPAVDGNVLRVVSRLALVREDIARPATRKAIASLAGELLRGVTRPGDLNQALMELGATVCVPARPRCEGCPVARHCRAQAAGLAASLPLKSSGRPPRAVVLAAALVERDGALLLVKRPASGIWAGLWAPPAVELAEVRPEAAADAGPRLQAALAAEGLAVEIGAPIDVLRHTLTHRQLTIPVFRARPLGAPPAGEVAWAGPDRLEEYALPVPFRRLVRGLDPGPLFRPPRAAEEGAPWPAPS